MGTLLKSDGHFGKMWECPDFFALDGEHVLLISPQDMLPEELEYHNGDGTEPNLRIILDRFSVEVFVDDGRKTMTATMYTELSADGISFRCEGRARMDVKQYQIEIG